MPDRRRLFMTATPRICTGTSADGTLLVTSMDDEQVFGPVAYRYPFRRGDRRRLAEGLPARGRRGHRRARSPGCWTADASWPAEGGVPSAMAAAQAALAMAAAQFGLRRTRGVPAPRRPGPPVRRQRCPATLACSRRPPPGRAAVAAGYVHGKMTSAAAGPGAGPAAAPARRAAGPWSPTPAAWARASTSPRSTRCCSAPRRNRSPTSSRPSGGRCARHGDADTATIIVPALLPRHGRRRRATMGRTRREPVRRTCCASCARCARMTRRSPPRCKPPAPAAPRARRAGRQPAGADHRAGPGGTLARTLDALRVRIIDGTTSSWWDGYGHARAYHASTATSTCRSRYVTASGFRLGPWLSAQRAERNSGALPAGRIELLDQIGMIWDRLEAAWMSAYQELRAFKDQHGHFEVPVDSPHRRRHQARRMAGHPARRRPRRELTASRTALLDADRVPLGPGRGPVDAPLPPADPSDRPPRRPAQPAPRFARGDLAGRPAPRPPPREAPRRQDHPPGTGRHHDPPHRTCG